MKVAGSIRRGGLLSDYHKIANCIFSLFLRVTILVYKQFTEQFFHCQKNI